MRLSVHAVTQLPLTVSALSAGSLEDWAQFQIAIAGAAAALTGLVIVGASVNIHEIVQAPSLTSRLASGIAGLVAALTVAVVGLMPGISSTGYAVAAAVVALLAGVFQLAATQRIRQSKDLDRRVMVTRAAPGFLAPVGYLIGAVLLIAGSDAAGLVAFGIAAILAIVAGVVISWVALVEVLR